MKEDILIKSKNTFETELEKRIKIGKAFLDKKIINTDEIEELKFDFSDWDEFNAELIKQSFNNPENESYKKYLKVNYGAGIADSLNRNINTATLDYKLNLTFGKFKNSIRYLKKLKNRIPLLKTTETVEKMESSNTKKKKFTNTGFIVHGHDDNLKLEVARFLEKQLLKDAIILHEKANRGKTVIEKFEEFSTVDFAIALWTKDDLGKASKEDNLKPRARQNVIFETGFFIGKISRENVIILYEKGIDIPSDYSGVVYIPIIGNWKESLRIEIDEIYSN